MRKVSKATEKNWDKLNVDVEKKKLYQKNYLKILKI